jgi:hypothetical protein
VSYRIRSALRAALCRQFLSAEVALSLTVREFKCRISTDLDDEFEIMKKLAKALPELRWDEGDSSWDKVRVWGEGADTWVRVYRYESPGPFELTVRLPIEGATPVEDRYEAIREKVLAALQATVC